MGIDNLTQWVIIDPMAKSPYNQVRVNTMNKATDTQRQELYALIEQARKQKERTSKIEDLVGNILFTILGSMVVSVIIGWATI
jgi:hypothetical protein